MCRNNPPPLQLRGRRRRATTYEAAALQYVRKISGMTKPSAANEAAFGRAIAAITATSARLLDELVTTRAAA